jgi:glycogen debranching enzyme
VTEPPAHTALNPDTAPPSTRGADAVQQVCGQVFSIAGPDGDMTEGLHGLYAGDIRMVSVLRLRVDGQYPELLSVQRPTRDSRVLVLGRVLPVGAADSVVLVERERRLDHCLDETVTLRNFGRDPVRLALEIEVGSDFADLFSVKEGRTSAVRATLRPQPPAEPTDPHGLPVLLRFGPTLPSPSVAAPHLSVAGDGDPQVDGGVLRWMLRLDANSCRSVRVRLEPKLSDSDPTSWLTEPQLLSRDPAPVLRGAAWIDCSGPGPAQVLRRAVADLDGLRLNLPHTRTPILAAGAPWFMTLFGRDSLLAGYMALPWDPALLCGALEALAATAGRDTNPAVEEAPGRILHELRLGEESARAIGGHRYYGSVDAAPLFMMMLAEAWRWGADERWVRGLLPTADAALEWARTKAAAHPAGFLAYRRATPAGLFNQGWKDSCDGVNDNAGEIPEPPIALCEVQAYHYRALLDRAELAEACGDDERAHRMRDEAAELRARFHEAFWLPRQGFPAIALDGSGHPVDALASNAAHCLWAGLLDDDPATELIAKLGRPDMASGWGLRTLSTTMAAYNPMSYHNGSVWPHDTALAVAGLARHAHLPGAGALARRLAGDLINAACEFGGSLPELMCGFAAQDYPRPVPYPSSCSPQAWAAAAPLLLLRSLLRLEPNLPAGRIGLDPMLPAEWETVSISGLRLGASTWDLVATGSEGHLQSSTPGRQTQTGTSDPSHCT